MKKEDKTERMEFVPLSDTVLKILCKDDSYLGSVFQGVFPEDKLPTVRKHHLRAGYIVNTDPTGEPGQHWLGIWTEGGECDVFDSYGFNLEHYHIPDIMKWLETWHPVWRSTKTLQAFNSTACGHYTLAFLRARARGQSLEDFLNTFSSHDLVKNDRKVGREAKKEIIDIFESHPYMQTCQPRYKMRH